MLPLHDESELTGKVLKYFPESSTVQNTMIFNYICVIVSIAIDRFQPHQVAMLREAMIFSARKHAGVMRTGEKAPYIVHLLRTCIILLNLDVRILPLLVALVLHDVYEDTDAKLKELQKMFGVKITQIIFLLSKNVPITPEMRALFGELAGDWLELPFFERLLAIPDLTLRIWCIVLKVVDRIDNLKTLKGMGHGRISRKIKETEEKIPPLLKHLEEVVEKSNPLHEVVENLGREYASALTLAKKTLAQEA